MAPSGSHKIGPSGQKKKISTDLERGHSNLNHKNAKNVIFEINFN
jgi:hypothetical protein